MMIMCTYHFDICNCPMTLYMTSNHDFIFRRLYLSRLVFTSAHTRDLPGLHTMTFPITLIDKT